MEVKKPKCEFCDKEKSILCEIKGHLANLCEECCRKELNKIKPG